MGTRRLREASDENMEVFGLLQQVMAGPENSRFFEDDIDNLFSYFDSHWVEDILEKRFDFDYDTIYEHLKYSFGNDFKVFNGRGYFRIYTGVLTIFERDVRRNLLNKDSVFVDDSGNLDYVADGFPSLGAKNFWCIEIHQKPEGINWIKTIEDSFGRGEDVGIISVDSVDEFFDKWVDNDLMNH